MAAPDTPPEKRRANRPQGKGPASENPGHGPAKGKGWGGPATGRKAPVYSGPVSRAQSIREHLEPAIQQLVENLVAIANDPTHPQQRAAIDSALDRYFGKAVQPTVNANVNKPASSVSTEDLLDMARQELGITIDGDAE